MEQHRGRCAPHRQGLCIFKGSVAQLGALQAGVCKDIFVTALCSGFARAGWQRLCMRLFVALAIAHMLTADAAARHPFLLHAVLEGMDVVTKVEAIGSSSGTPSKKVTIADSGELPLEAKADEI